MNKINILHCTIGSMNIGGIENMIMEMYRHINRNRFNFDFLVHDFEKNFYEDEIKSLGGKLYRINFLSKNPIKHIFDFYKLLKKNPQYQIIHIHTTYSIMFTDVLISKLFNKKVIVHSHNSSAKGKRRLIHLLFKPIQELFTDYRFSCSELASRWMFLSRNQEKSLFWPNALDIRHLKYNFIVREEIRKKYNVTDKVVIGNIGRLVYQKNQTKLLNIFANYNSHNPNSELWLIGDGPDRKILEILCNNLGICDKVRFLGEQNNISEYLSAMDLFILTSRFEGLPLSLIETQASGLLTLSLSDNITKLVKVSSTLKYVENSLSDEDWNTIIEKTLDMNIDRNKSFTEVQKSDFNIFNWIAKVENYYERINNGGDIFDN